MQLTHGTRDDHLATLARAKANRVDYVWSGDIRRNEYLAENLRFGIESGALTAKWVEYEQESGWEIKWL